METRAELGIDADPMAASVAVMATTTTLPGESVSPFACTSKRVRVAACLLHTEFCSVYWTNCICRGLPPLRQHTYTTRERVFHQQYINSLNMLGVT